MKQEKCPLCGTPLIEEVNESENQNSTTRPLTSACAEATKGSIDIYLAPSIRFRVVVHRCPNPECGYLSSDW